MSLIPIRLITMRPTRPTTKYKPNRSTSKKKTTRETRQVYSPKHHNCPR